MALFGPRRCEVRGNRSLQSAFADNAEIYFNVEIQFLETRFFLFYRSSKHGAEIYVDVVRPVVESLRLCRLRVEFSFLLRDAKRYFRIQTITEKMRFMFAHVNKAEMILFI